MPEDENKTESPADPLERWQRLTHRIDGSPLDDRALIQFLFGVGHQCGTAGMDTLYAMMHIAACAIGKLAGLSHDEMLALHNDDDGERQVVFELYREILHEFGVITVDSQEELQAVLQAMRDRPDKEDLN